MNLLTAPWIPIQQSGIQEKITLQQLLSAEKTGELCLPRDDLELACLQLITALTQVLFTPKDKKELGKRVKKPIAEKEFVDACEGKLDWFDIKHPDTPFMQFRGVKSKEPTGMTKLLAGVADGTNKSFVNPQGLGDGLCADCAAIALYNTAYNCPSMGGGFKASMRGSTPITVLVRSNDLRSTIWHNVLTAHTLEKEMPWYLDTQNQVPNYVEGLNAGNKIHASQIGLVKGLFWQPAKFELCVPEKRGMCSVCGCQAELYTGFNKEKFNYTIDGIWPYPLSSRIFTIKKGQREEKFPSFTTNQPTWVHLSKLIVNILREKDGYHAAPVVKQLEEFGMSRLNLIIGGYRNNQATVLERRHEFFSISDGWQEHGQLIDYIINHAQEYRKALRKALYVFGNGVKDRFSGTGVDLTDRYDTVFFQKTESMVKRVLSEINFDNPNDVLVDFWKQLEALVIQLFEQATKPYQQEPKMLKALASSRRYLMFKYLKELKTLQGEAA